MLVDEKSIRGSTASEGGWEAGCHGVGVGGIREVAPFTDSAWYQSRGLLAGDRLSVVKVQCLTGDQTHNRVKGTYGRIGVLWVYRGRRR